MCLLITQPAGTVFSETFLRGVFKKNGDGIGVMYAENNTLYVRKDLPKTYEEMKAFYDEHVAGKACAVHWRMQTHGHINLDNCHPYEVISEAEGYPLWLMHNGVLHTNNLKDKAKSDTWHYIQDYLRPMLLNNPAWFMSPEFSELVGNHIGSNKFTLLDAYGNMVTVNEEQGVKYNGAWLSNTYAWDTTGTEHAPRYYSYGSYSQNSVWDMDEDWRGNWRQEVGPVSLVGADDACGEWVEVFREYMDSVFGGGEYSLTQYELEDYFNTVGENDAWYLMDIIDEGLTDMAEIVEIIMTKVSVMAQEAI